MPNVRRPTIRAYEGDFVGRRYGAMVAVVTGANSGVRLHAALGLPCSGVRVVMTGRDRARIEASDRR